MNAGRVDLSQRRIEHGDIVVVHREAGTELWMSACRDPDGHHVALMQERSA